tara:strand:- start:971 stop:1723 length:753 start_codon:yes stop_codon:yes gene_type:complete
MEGLEIYKEQTKNVYSVLSKEQKHSLFEKMNSGDEDARNQLISSCLPLVIKVATKFYKKYKKVIDLDDLIQIGNFALSSRIKSFNPEYELSTFATRVVSNAMIDSIMDNKYNVNSYVNLNRYASKNVIEIKKVGSNDIDKISKATKIKPEKIKRLLEISDVKRDKIPKNEGVQKFSMNANINGCLADMINLLQDNVDSDKEREIFMRYVYHINKPNKIRLLCNEFNKSPDSIKVIVNKIKKVLKKSTRSV